MNSKALMIEFEKVINPSIVNELFFEFEQLRSFYWLGDVTKTVLHAARFCEISIALLKHVSDPTKKVDLNSIEFGKYFEELIKLPKNNPKEEMLYLVIPQVLKSIYTVRSKKKIAHIKMTNADLIDAEWVTTSCNWVMSQLIIIYLNIPVEETITITNSIMEKKIPTIQQFEDGELMILKKLQLDDELLLILYQFSKRMTRKELTTILKPKKTSYISTYLNRLYDAKLIHLNEAGAIINKNGIKEIEDNRDKYFSN